MIKIPIFQNVSADNTQEINLDGQLVQIRLVFNIRNDSWHLYFKDQNGNEISGIKLVTDWPILDSHKGFTDFRGDFVILRTNNEVGSEITYENIGNGWGLFYLTPAELIEWKESNGI